MAYYLTKEDYLEHRASGYTKKNHKYITRFWKNGKWFYVYKNGKRYNKIQDWLGVDEADRLEKASMKLGFATAKYTENQKSGAHKKDQEKEKKDSRDLDNAARFAANRERAYNKTPLGRLSNLGKYLSDGESWIVSKLRKKK